MALKKNRRSARPTDATNRQPELPTVPSADERLDISALEQWLWDAACAIRGATDAPKFKDFILPLVFYKRLSDVFGDEDVARDVIAADHADALAQGRTPIVRFFIPEQYRWPQFRKKPPKGTLGEFVKDAMNEVARLNPDLQG